MLVVIKQMMVLTVPYIPSLLTSNLIIASYILQQREKSVVVAHPACAAQILGNNLDNDPHDYQHNNQLGSKTCLSVPKTCMFLNCVSGLLTMPSTCEIVKFLCPGES